MKCKKCGNEYPSQYYFATQDICQTCFEKLDDTERESELNSMRFYNNDVIDLRIGFGRRFGAALIDIMIVTVITLIVFYFSGFYSDLSNFMTIIQDIPPTQTQEIMREYMNFMDSNKVHLLLMIGLNLVYFSLEVFVGASLGKMLLGIQIMSKDREQASYLNLLVRFALKYSNSILNLVFFATMLYPVVLLNNLISIVMLIGLFFIFSSKKQTLYDMISSTAVYRKTEE
jgi:uncharacterized RDD family membrane protein YckC